jgi:hypothetical protein
MKWLLPFLLLFSLIACEKVVTHEPDSRPSNIPQSALWIGGSDGGVYALIQLTENTYTGTIYYDSTGDVWYEGEFIYTGKSSFNLTDHNNYSAWDGDVLHLTNGHKLISRSSE